MINNFDLKKFLVENKVTLNSRLNEEEDFEDFTTTAPPEWNVTFLKKGDPITRDMCLDNIPIHDSQFPVTIKGFSKNAVLIQSPPTYSPSEKQEWVGYDRLNKLLKPEYRVRYKFK